MNTWQNHYKPIRVVADWNA